MVSNAKKLTHSFQVAHFIAYGLENSAQAA
jgi:hypothetical protein